MSECGVHPTNTCTRAFGPGNANSPMCVTKSKCVKPTRGRIARNRDRTTLECSWVCFVCRVSCVFANLLHKHWPAFGGPGGSCWCDGTKTTLAHNQRHTGAESYTNARAHTRSVSHRALSERWCSDRLALYARAERLNRLADDACVCVWRSNRLGARIRLCSCRQRETLTTEQLND